MYTAPDQTRPSLLRLAGRLHLLLGAFADRGSSDARVSAEGFEAYLFCMGSLAESAIALQSRMYYVGRRGGCGVGGRREERKAGGRGEGSLVPVRIA